MTNFKRSILSKILTLLLVISFAWHVQSQSTNYSELDGVVISKRILIDSVWAANKVSFALHTVRNKQFVAYYDKDRMMTVASRELGSTSWQKKKLPSKLKWDSHNSVAMGIDEEGYIHISGNMHVNPLIYFRSTKPYDINSLTEFNNMLGIEESDVTYPKFFYDGDEHLYFSYRSGTCGNGNILINQFGAKAQSWIRHLEKPLFEGIEKDDDRAAYHRLVKDSKGVFHYIWMWRSTPEVATSHQICYASSPDLLNWKNAAGEEVQLPFRPDNPKLIVDPTYSKGGMHNSKYQMILTPKESPIIGYLKYDEQGLTQLYLAKFENSKWLRKKISNWNFRWKFVGGGDKMSKGASFSLEGFTKEGELVIDWNTEVGEEGEYVVDLNNLEVVEKSHDLIRDLPANIKNKISKNPKLLVAIQEDNGQSPNQGIKYALKWEAMRKSHGRHAPKIIPEGPVSPLFLLQIKSEKQTDN